MNQYKWKTSQYEKRKIKEVFKMSKKKKLK